MGLGLKYAAREDESGTGVTMSSMVIALGRRSLVDASTCTLWFREAATLVPNQHFDYEAAGELEGFAQTCRIFRHLNSKD